MKVLVLLASLLVMASQVEKVMAAPYDNKVRAYLIKRGFDDEDDDDKKDKIRGVGAATTTGKILGAGARGFANGLKGEPEKKKKDDDDFDIFKDDPFFKKKN